MTTHAKFVKPHMRGRAKMCQPFDVHTTLRISLILDEELRCFAAKYSTSKADLIRRCLHHGIAALRRKEKPCRT